MEKQTAVEWLVDELNKSTSLTSFVPECNDDYKQEILGIIEQAKAMEKEQCLKMLPYDLDELFDEIDKSIDYHEFDFTSFRLGFQKALELLTFKSE